MCGDRSVLLCVVCFVSGLVIRCVVSVSVSIVNLKLYIPWSAVGWKLGAVRLEASGYSYS